MSICSVLLNPGWRLVTNRNQVNSAAPASQGVSVALYRTRGILPPAYVDNTDYNPETSLYNLFNREYSVWHFFTRYPPPRHGYRLLSCNVNQVTTS